MAPLVVAGRSLCLLDRRLLLPVRPPRRQQQGVRQQCIRVTTVAHAGSGFRTTRTLTISYPDLKDEDRDLSTTIEEGFGPSGLGIISISDVPGYPSLRENLLHLAPRVASLPDDTKRDLEDPESRYNFGWSHAKEEVEPGKLDTSKGSFYANPILDIPTTDLILLQRYPSYCRPNKWPQTSLPELEEAFKALGKMLLDIGLKLAYHCHKYVTKKMVVWEDESIEQILRRSRCHKGRLLYYFPRHASDSQAYDTSTSSWCGWHTDHGSLTGLTCGMFTRDGLKIACPDSAAGLYVKTRNDEIVRVVFEENEIAYQIGETTEILSKGHLCATPHCVQAPIGENAFGVDRSTFALFMQPDWNENLRFPGEIHHHQELIPPNGVLAFGEYSEKVVGKYYPQL